MLGLLGSPYVVQLEAEYDTDEEFSFYIRDREPRPLTSIAMGNPAIIEMPGHCFKTGDRINISSTNCCPSIESLGEFWVVTRIDDDFFSIPANVDLHGGTEGIVTGPLRDLTGWTFSGGIYQYNTVTDSRFLDAVADTLASSSRVVLKSNVRSEIETDWDTITIINSGITDSPYIGGPVEDESGGGFSYVSQSGTFYPYQRVITTDTESTTPVTEGRVKVSFSKQGTTLNKIVTPTFNINAVNGSISILFNRADLTSAINGGSLLIFATSPAGNKTKIVEGSCSFSVY